MTTIDLSLLDSLTLSNGSHEDREDGVCAMEAAAYIAGEEHSDHPACVSPVITRFMVNWNDSLPDDVTRDRLLKPLLPLVIGTRTNADDEETRAWLAFDWLARVCTPAWLRLAGLTEEAQLLEGTARIVDAATCDAAMPALGRARQRADAASEAARAAAREAASAAAWAAAWEAASEAAWAAASEAARAAARAAASEAASAAAWEAASAAAWAAAWAAASEAASAAASEAASAAAWAAAWEAARAAARAAASEAAWDALRPTVAALQDSASALVRAMCAVGRKEAA